MGRRDAIIEERCGFDRGPQNESQVEEEVQPCSIDEVLIPSPGQDGGGGDNGGGDFGGWIDWGFDPGYWGDPNNPDPGNQFGNCEQFMDCYGGGETPNNSDPCTQSKGIISNPKLAPEISKLQTFAKTSINDEKGFKDNKDGTITPADVNGIHKVQFNNIENMNGAYHNHTLTGVHMFSAHDISTMIEIARYNGIMDPTKAYLGMVSTENQYIISFNGSQGDLPATSFDEGQLMYYDLLEFSLAEQLVKMPEYSNDTMHLNEKGLQKLFFDTLDNLGLSNKVNLISVSSTSTSNISKDANGNPISQPCP